VGTDRSKIDDKFKWQLDKMYSSKENIEKDIKIVKEYINEVKKYKGKLSDNRESFLNALSVYENANRLVQNLYVYTHMKQHEDTRINSYQGDASRTEMLSSELSMATSYIVPEIIAMDEKVLNGFLEDEKASFYKKFIDEILRDKPHTLSEREEELLAATSELTSVPENVYDMLAYADMEFPEIEDENGEKVRISHSNYSLYIKSKDKRVRKDAFEAEFNTYGTYKNTFASTLYGAIKSEIFYAKVRNHNSAIEASLFEDDINVEVYENLIASMDESLPVLNKEKILGA